MIKTVIFDLDGTLADTVSLGAGRRVPWQLLRPGCHVRPDWSFSPEVSDLPGELIARGYQVVVATRSPMPYASTLMHLIGADTQQIRASCGAGRQKAFQLKALLVELGREPMEALYVGDTPEDPEIAQAAGVQYADVSHVRSGELLRSLPWIRISPRLRPIDLRTSAPKFTAGTYGVDTRSVRADQVAEALSTSIQEGVPDEQSHERWLNEIFQHPEITKQDRAALCFFTLMQHPGTSLRRWLQHGLLVGLEPANANCVIKRSESVFAMYPQLVTRTELRRDATLQRRYLLGLQAMFPCALGTINVGRRNIPVKVLQTYKVGFGSVLGGAKNYGGTPGTRYRSGPGVRLGLLDLISDITSTGCDDLDDTPLVPVPPSPFSTSQPGEVSLRLAQAVAQLTGRPVKLALLRDGDEITINRSERPGPVLLIDDQTTSGTTLTTASEVLLSCGYTVRSIVSFSANREFLGQIGAKPHFVRQRCGFRQVARWLRLACPCERQR
jgi:FMN phosphatase YigB (HAD superfamily)